VSRGLNVDPKGRNAVYPQHDRAARRYFVAEIAQATWQPNIDIYQTTEAIVVLVELAGVKPESVHLSIDGKSLRLSGTRIPPVPRSYRHFYQLEIAQGAYERVVRLPTLVDGDRAEAAYHDGFLEVILPIAQPIRPHISSAEATQRGSRD
jgi:HSP20 family protein